MNLERLMTDHMIKISSIRAAKKRSIMPLEKILGKHRFVFDMDFIEVNNKYVVANVWKLNNVGINYLSG